MLFSSDEKADLRTIGMIRFRWNSKIQEYRVINSVASNRMLGIEDSILTNINSCQNSNAAANDMLRVWMGSDSKATWAKLIQAMRVKEELTTATEEFQHALQNRINYDFV